MGYRNCYKILLLRENRKDTKQEIRKIRNAGLVPKNLRIVQDSSLLRLGVT